MVGNTFMIHQWSTIAWNSSLTVGKTRFRSQRSYLTGKSYLTSLRKTQELYFQLQTATLSLTSAALCIQRIDLISVNPSKKKIEEMPLQLPFWKLQQLK